MMKKILMIELILMFIILSCSMEDNSYSSSGTITGVDTRECACCGGYFIDIDNYTYRFDVLPNNSSLDLTNAEFPVNVKLDWHPDPDACIGDEIIIERIAKR